MTTTKLSSWIIAAAAVTAFSSGAFAANITDVQSSRAVNQWQDMTKFQSSKTRAEVRQEVLQGDAQGISGQHEYVEFGVSPVKNMTSRANVKSELGKSSANTVLQPNDVYYGS